MPFRPGRLGQSAPLTCSAPVPFVLPFNAVTLLRACGVRNASSRIFVHTAVHTPSTMHERLRVVHLTCPATGQCPLHKSYRKSFRPTAARALRRGGLGCATDRRSVTALPFQARGIPLSPSKGWISARAAFPLTLLAMQLCLKLSGRSPATFQWHSLLHVDVTTPIALHCASAWNSRLHQEPFTASLGHVGVRRNRLQTRFHKGCRAPHIVVAVWPAVHPQHLRAAAALTLGLSYTSLSFSQEAPRGTHTLNITDVRHDIDTLA